MRIKDSARLQPALSLIAYYDPGLFARMQASNWTVHVMAGPDDLEPLFNLARNGQIELSMLAAMGESLTSPSVMGLTVNAVRRGTSRADIPSALLDQTWLAWPQVSEATLQFETSAARVAAMVLVHEFQHYLGYGEGPAYDAGMAFARKMGENKMADSQARDKQLSLREEAEMQRLIDEENARYGGRRSA
jgi:hypothetical protein